MSSAILDLLIHTVLKELMGNPSLSTLQRIAEGLGVQLHIDFTAKKDTQSSHNKTTKRLTSNTINRSSIMRQI